ncbi:L-threonylcarbamoyladenylate synthase [Arthrobacter sp.]|uniref:L-threonylcarbamoyladenylate synthase n=1 Tax=Arthrobacter sp. TaxID=1667 RepID=UPI002810B296|nr:L-threonylcarbamoyladenylate synthase [Arthrobacter sp.]
MTTTYNCTASTERYEGLQHAQRAIRENKCVVLPTDTVYGIAADAFSPQAVTMLLVSKGRGRQMPPPVLIPRLNALDGLATDVPAEARKLAEAFWPGGLTLILHAQPSLDWDLGDTKGTVALRIPADELARDLLNLTGPLAVSSANRTGQPAARTAGEAREQLAESVEVYLEDGLRPEGASDAVPSTIVDATSLPLRVVRDGAVSLERLREVVPGVLGLGEEAPEQEAPEAETPGSESPAAEAPQLASPEIPEAEAPGTESPEGGPSEAEATPETETVAAEDPETASPEATRKTESEPAGKQGSAPPSGRDDR